MTRQAYLLHDRKLAIFWTPKAACTTIADVVCEQVIGRDALRRRPAHGSRRHRLVREALFRAERGLRLPAGTLAPEPTTARRKWLKHNGYRVRGQDALRLCLDEGYSSIALIREPYDRLVSAYVSKFVHRRGVWLDTEDKLESFARAALEDYHGSRPARGSGPRSWSFREFVHFVCDKLDDPAGADGRLNHHWNTQIPPHFRSLGFDYDYLYDTSRSDAFFGRLGKLTDTRLAPRRANRTEKSEAGTATAPGSLVDLQSSELARERRVGAEGFFDPALRDRVRHSFAVDYDYLEKCRRR